MFNLPRTLAAEEELRKMGNHPWNAAQLEDWRDAGADAQVEALVHDAAYGDDFDPSDPAGVDHGAQNSREVGDIPIEGADAVMKLGTNTLSKIIRDKYTASPIPSFITKIDFWTAWISPDFDPNVKPNFLLKFLHPEVFADYHVLRAEIPLVLQELQVRYEEEVLRDAYSPPSVRARAPRIWLPRDEAGVSAQEIRHCGRAGVETRDDGAWVDGKGIVGCEPEGEVGEWVERGWDRVRF